MGDAPLMTVDPEQTGGDEAAKKVDFVETETGACPPSMHSVESARAEW